MIAQQQLRFHHMQVYLKLMVEAPKLLDGSLLRSFANIFCITKRDSQAHLQIAVILKEFLNLVVVFFK